MKLIIKLWCMVAIITGVLLLLRGATNTNGFGELVIGVLMIVSNVGMFWYVSQSHVR